MFFSTGGIISNPGHAVKKCGVKFAIQSQKMQILTKNRHRTLGPVAIDLFIQHNLQNGLVCLAHALPGQTAYILYRLVRALGDDAVTA